MDLDDDELKATRRMNGSDKNVGSMKEDIKILENLLEEGFEAMCYLEAQAMEHLIKAYKELEEKWDKDTHKLQNALNLANADKINNYTPNSKIKEKIEEFKLKIEKYYEHKIQGKETDVEFYENITNIEIVRVLQELLEGK